MQYRDLRDFISGLEKRGELKRIQVPVSPVLEMTEVCDRTLRAKGPALLFENPTGYDIPVLGNLFGTPERVALGMGAEAVSELREIGKATDERLSALINVVERQISEGRNGKT